MPFTKIFSKSNKSTPANSAAPTPAGSASVTPRVSTEMLRGHNDPMAALEKLRKEHFAVA
ncbi:hypothetical protein EC988_002374, partial [Linderina pennispora]